MREWNFLRDRNHRHWWWLRDPSKVLDFLASHQKELELDHEAEFTDNFRRLTSGIKRAELRTSATESENGAEVEVRIEAGRFPRRTRPCPRHRAEPRPSWLKSLFAHPRTTRTSHGTPKTHLGQPRRPPPRRASHRVEKFQAPLRGGFPSRSRSPASKHPPNGKNGRRPARSLRPPPRASTKASTLSSDPIKRPAWPGSFTSFATDSEASSQTKWDWGRPSRPSASDRSAQRTRLCQDLPRGLPRHPA